MTLARVGTVSYVNARPLTDALDRASYDVMEDIPSVVAERLVQGQIDVGLVPVRALLDHPDLRVVPGWCVGADGPVHSVVIAAEAEPEDWRELVLDGSSRTSITLAELLVRQGPLADRVRPDLTITHGAPGDGPRRVGGAVAAVVIGDPARALPEHLQRWDLAELWKAWTGRPFVFAVWAARPGLSAQVREDLRVAGARGVAQISDRYQGEDRAYLTTFLRYPLDDAALVGLREFAARAYASGLVVADSVTMLDPPRRRRARRDLDVALSDAAEGVSPDLATLRALAEDVSGADLHLAAHLRRQSLHPEPVATWLHAAGEGVAWEGTAPDAITLVDAQERSLDSLYPAAQAILAQGQTPRLDERPTWLTPDVARRLGLAVVPVAADDVTRDEAARWVDAGLALSVDLWLDRPNPWATLASLAEIARHVSVLSVVVHLPLPQGALVAPGQPTPAAYLRGVALTRLALTGDLHVVASPVTQGLELAQAALLAGADDLGVVGAGADGHALPAGVARFEVTAPEAERHLRAAGFEPVRRGVDHARLGGAITRPRRVRPVTERDRAAVHVREV